MCRVDKEELIGAIIAILALWKIIDIFLFIILHIRISIQVI